MREGVRGLPFYPFIGDALTSLPHVDRFSDHILETVRKFGEENITGG